MVRDGRAFRDIRGGWVARRGTRAGAYSRKELICVKTPAAQRFIVVPIA